MIELVDQTIRDGQQSLWGMRLPAGMALPVADALDRAGFRAVDVTGSSLMEVLGALLAGRTRGRASTCPPWLRRSALRAGMRSNGSARSG